MTCRYNTAPDPRPLQPPLHLLHPRLTLLCPRVPPIRRHGVPVLRGPTPGLPLRRTAGEERARPAVAGLGVCQSAAERRRPGPLQRPGERRHHLAAEDGGGRRTAAGTGQSRRGEGEGNAGITGAVITPLSLLEGCWKSCSWTVVFRTYRRPASRRH